MPIAGRWLPNLFVALVILGQVAWSQSPATWSGEIDGVPTWVTVVPRGHHPLDREVVASSPWWEWGNAETDAYLFAFNDPGTVHLILEFEQLSNGRPRAKLYGADWGASPLDYQLDGVDLTVVSNGGYPNIVIEPLAGGWYVDGQINYRLQMWEDGYVEIQRTQAAPEERVPDGRAELRSTIGIDAQGDPLWETTERIFDPHPTWAGVRFGATARTEDGPPYAVEEPLMPAFPHLQIRLAPPNWFDLNPRPIYFDLRRMQLRTNSFIGFQIGDTYWLNSQSYPPYVSFESPFALYNFDPSTRQAHMVIRAESFPAEVPQGPEPKNFTRTAFRYSWKTTDDTLWRFGIHVAGPFPYDEDVTIGNITFKNVSMATLPAWVADKAWPLVTFVEPTRGYPGSEGIYYYNANDPEHLAWLSGSSDAPVAWLETPFLIPNAVLSDIPGEGLPPGYRAEYHPAYFRVPDYYFSPIDNRLHLSHAAGGVWHLSEGRFVRYHNLGGGPHINGWTRERLPEEQREILADSAFWTLQRPPPMALPAEVEASLYALGDHLIYSTPDRVAIRLANADQELFRLSTPTDEESWEAFRDTIAPYQNIGRDPSDFQSWFNAFSGPTRTFSAARLEGMRNLEQGFQFVLVITPETQVGGGLALPGLDGLEAGRHLVRYDATTDSWTSEPAVTLLPTASLRSPPLEAFHSTPLTLAIRNLGNTDWQGSVSLYLDGELEKAWPSLLIPGDGTVTERLFWVSPPGEYDAYLELDGTAFPLEPLIVQLPARGTAMNVLSLSIQNPLAILACLLLLVVAARSLVRAWRPA